MNKLMMGIIGNRNFKSMLFAESLIRRTLYEFKPYKPVVISGGAKGIDTLAVKIANEMEIETKIIMPKVRSIRGYFARNKRIAKLAEYLLCFINSGKYKAGTWNTINYFTRHKYEDDKLFIYNEYGNLWRVEDYPQWLKSRCNL